MAGSWIKGGVPREINLNGNDYAAAEGETITYMLSGRGGPVKVDGNNDAYQESNPYLGGFNQVLSVDENQFESLKTAQESGQKITGYVTMPSGKTFNCFGGISSDGALENDNGTVSIEFRGKYEPQ